MIPFLIALALGLLAYYTARRLLTPSVRRPAWLPNELQSAKLAFVEKDFFTATPYRIAGRPDQVYRLPNGSFVPVELKTRAQNRVFDTDVAELSLQAWLLRQKNKRTARHGYVAILNTTTHENTALRVDLWDDERCEAAIARYLDLMAGRAMPRKCGRQKCKGCGHTAYC